ncbi:hypothetical protein roselon_03509 [Roseibacterium elongatum DSM 19469]|uniref:DUF4268 domain-containing protein n=1 Tax=Roseicyclus elongatus DSM 19469 TaxID=1294273 RepID=W8RX25_9RHOB|nr:hypothetical protein [Roseibacterium elongatum]AHM05764.1 hypothetical protein roselon_03509 [Roseibacterium elongatum DSM 19469]
MTDIRFDRLIDLPLRDAWKHEALDFTPWLAENIEHLSEAIGVPLELTGTEVSVETFSADILARNPMNDGVVLIENQLEMTDHTHLGQIMTYLAGLGAQTVIWIAPAFREPHLSAIRWLNEHTADGFSFFAVRARVVRIGDSPFAPIFDVVEKPSGWERTLGQVARARGSASEVGDRRLAFWTAYLERVPSAAEWGLKPSRLSSMWVPLSGLVSEAYLSLWIGADDCGAFMRGARGSDASDLIADLQPHAQRLEETLGATFNGNNGQFLWNRAGLEFSEEANWPAIIDWMENTRRAYLEALSSGGRSL